MPGSSDYPVAGVRIVADTSDFDSAISELIAKANKIDNSVKIEVTADTSSAKSDLNALDSLLDTSQTVNVEADTIDAKSDLLALDDIIDESQTVNVEADTTDAKADLSTISDQLQSLQNLSVIQLVLDAAQFVQTFQSLPIFSFLAETDSALSSIKARTGEAIDGLDAVVNRIYVETGADKATIADALVPLIQDGETSLSVLEDMGIRAVEFSQVWGEDVNATLFAANQLIGTGLADNSEDAFNILIYGMQTGANRASDFLDLIGEFGADFAQLGLTGQEMVDLTNASLDAGAQNAGRYGEAINSLAQNFDAMGEDTAAVVEATGIDPDNLGVEGLASVIEHLKSIEDQAERTTAMTATFGSGGTEIGEALTFVLPDEQETRTSIEGTADEMSAAVNDSLTEAFREAAATLETSVIEALDNALDLSGRLETFKSQLTGFADDLQAGMGLGEALEVNFGLQGVDDFITRFEGAMGNVVIAILELVAGVRDIQGIGSEGVRAEIARLSGQQLAFDLQAVTPDEMAGVLRTAIDRGVEGAALQTALSTAVSEAIAEGNSEQAQAIVDAAAAIDGLRIDMGGGLFEETVKTIEVETSGLQQAVDSAFEAAVTGKPGVSDINLTEQLRLFENLPTPDDVASFTAGQAVDATDVAAASAAVAFSDTFIAMSEAAAAAESDTVGSMEGIEEALVSMGDTTTEVIQGNTVITDFELMQAAALASAPVVVGAAGQMEDAFSSFGGTASRQIEMVIGKLSELQNVFSSVFGDLSALGNLSNVVNNAVTTANVNIVNNNQSSAQAVSANQQAAAAIRGVTS